MNELNDKQIKRTMCWIKRQHEICSEISLEVSINTKLEAGGIILFDPPLQGIISEAQITDINIKTDNFGIKQQLVKCKPINVDMSRYKTVGS
ncbi:MAG: hypothetical protein KAU50_11500 [Candidatus Marinimicrobia bacterium]|nr:hypothetical protein [Candidatus Neomarinimicrobiota bacterium]